MQGYFSPSCFDLKCIIWSYLVFYIQIDHSDTLKSIQSSLLEVPGLNCLTQVFLAPTRALGVKMSVCL